MNTVIPFEGVWERMLDKKSRWWEKKKKTKRKQTTKLPPRTDNTGGTKHCR